MRSAAKSFGGYAETPSQAERMAITSPFRNGDMQKTGAKALFEHDSNPLLAYVQSKDEHEFLIALPCEHIAAVDKCRLNCSDWKAAVEEAAIELGG